ncbi:MAG: hypothetical protein ISQ32_01410 [Rickettsiales bacterium]|nr:hypothetical protein [Rickettsiales bacterium]
MVDFATVNGKLSITQEQHQNSYNRLIQYKNDFNRNITDEQLKNYVDKGLEKIFSNQDKIDITTPNDVLSVVWALEYTNAVQGQVSPESFVKIVDNGKIYEALKKYNQEHNEIVDKPKNQTKGEELRSYSYRRISSHSSEYSGEEMVDSPDHFITGNKIPLQFGIDIRNANGGPMLPGGKNTILFHKENPALNQNKSVLGIKYEQAGFPSFNSKAIKHTLSESFDHIDQYISTRENQVFKFVASVFDVIKATFNIIPKLLNFVTLGTIGFPEFNLSSVDRKFQKEPFYQKPFTMVTDLILSGIAAGTLGFVKPYGIESKTESSFREHMKDVKFDREKLGNQITKFAKSLDNPELNEALSHKRIGEVMNKLKEIENKIPEDKKQEFEDLQTKFNSWMEERGHNPETKHLRSGEERILDVTGEISPIKYNEKNNGDSLTEFDKQQDVNKKKFKESGKEIRSSKVHPTNPYEEISKESFNKEDLKLINEIGSNISGGNNTKVSPSNHGYSQIPTNLNSSTEVQR